jgi:hypothetical protein
MESDSTTREEIIEMALGKSDASARTRLRQNLARMRDDTVDRALVVGNMPGSAGTVARLNYLLADIDALDQAMAALVD